MSLQKVRRPLLGSSLFLALRRDLLNSPLFPCLVRLKTAPRPSIPASRGSAAATPEKFYHTACAGCGCPAAPARRDQSSFESAARIPASATAPPAAPEIPQRHCAHLPAATAPVPPRWDHLALRMAAGPQSHRTTVRRGRLHPARSWQSRTAPRLPCS